MAIALRNVKAAGLSKEVSIAQQDFANFEQPAQKSILITNPPYGERISAPDLLGLYRMIGERLKHEFQGNEAWVLSYREECFDKIGLKPSLRTPLFNGSLECELRKYQMFSGKFNDLRAQGGDIKTAHERRLMADHKRFKQHREFRDRLEDEPEERMPRKRWEEDRRTADDRRRGTDRRWRASDREKRSFERGERPFDRNKRPFDREERHNPFREERRGAGKPFDRKGGNKNFGKKRYDEEED